MRKKLIVLEVSFKICTYLERTSIYISSDKFKEIKSHQFSE